MINEKSEKNEKVDLIEVIVDYEKNQFKCKFSKDTKILNIEEWFKRKISIAPSQSVYFFEKKKKRLLRSQGVIGDMSVPYVD